MQFRSEPNSPCHSSAVAAELKEDNRALEKQQLKANLKVSSSVLPELLQALPDEGESGGSLCG